MAEYIDRESLLKHLPDDLPYKASVKRVLMQPLAADVVPREDADRLRHILNSYAIQYGTVKDQKEVIDRIKQDTAREIFAVVDTLGTYNPTLYAELKNKYTEDVK